MPARNSATVNEMMTGTAAAFALSIGLCGPAIAQTTIDWPTFGGSAQRSNYNASETTLSVASVPGMTLHWKAKIGVAYKYQPTLVRSVTTPKGTLDLVVMTLDDGSVTALNAATGKTVWSTSLGQTEIPCPGSTALEGIGEPATLDVANGRAFVVDAAGMLHALSLSTGAEMAGYPVEVIDAPNLAAGTWVHFASPTLVGNNLYLGTSAYCETKAVPYHGQVIQFSTSSISVVNRFYPLGNGAVLGGGVWGTGGVAVEPDGSSLWIGTANSLPPPENTGNAEKVMQISPSLSQLAVNGPVLKKGSDLDFGSTPLLFQPAGCPPMLAAMNKSGALLVYNRTNLAAGPTQTLNISAGSGSGKLIGMASFDPVTNAVYVDNPADSTDGTYLHGLLALQANGACSLSLLWQQTVGANDNKSPSVTPTIANGVVYLSEGITSELAAFDAATGTPLWNSGDIGTAKAAPMVVNGQVFVGAGKFVYAFGL
jgi:outer membrane protein assembly factor BamB